MPIVNEFIMKYTHLSLALLPILSMTSCLTTESIYQSPFHGTTNSYKAIPLRQDSIKAATYVSGIFTGGGANQYMRDGLMAFSGTVHRSHNFGYIQGYYGISGALGRYNIKRSPAYAMELDQPLSAAADSTVQRMAGGKFFGGYGAIGGINAVIPFGRFEWRALGVEASWQREFGDYLDFRKQLADSLANGIDRRKTYMAIAFSTDFLWRLKKGSIGFKTAVSTSTHRVTRSYRAYRNHDSMESFALLFHLTIKKITGSFQFNTGDYATNIQTGLHYRLGR
jgi:hypothetical protein